ncbi:hypothetical protein P9293_00060 [Bacillus inaquosorum]|uniref:hypothetical protein n=1 Tax=Bacillus subtilis group TaxID=653685 RepID=UPI000D044C0A|nr:MULTISPECIES: hypothetical protein [Bacillus subtilis group]MEC0596612.1 hypothetical protein [Bacillus spizizenii]MDQ7723549.1 hypothetical protein [Bacillus halotolerans]MED4645804.1 hypothetical protein [Bacillus inaquosorum]MED4790655.1 hypothetical protein [Bacillus inaquosorum]PRP56869.1 hypothetical protein C7B71_02680 [Bacillus halotolerans]
MSEKFKEIEEILKLVEKKKNFYLLQTNPNEREDLSQELDLLIFKKLQTYLEKSTSPDFYKYLKENIGHSSIKE